MFRRGAGCLPAGCTMGRSDNKMRLFLLLSVVCLAGCVGSDREKPGSAQSFDRAGPPLSSDTSGKLKPECLQAFATPVRPLSAQSAYRSFAKTTEPQQGSSALLVAIPSRLDASTTAYVASERNRSSSPLRDGYNGWWPLEARVTRGESQYVGSNAFGVQATVTRSVEDQYGIVFYAGGVYLPPEWPLNRFSSASVLLTPDEARDKDKIAIAFLGDVVAPSTVTYSYRQYPTMHSPSDVDATHRGVVMKPTCAAVVHLRTGNVLTIVP